MSLGFDRTQGYRLNDPFDTSLITNPGEDNHEKILASKVTGPDKEMVPPDPRDFTTESYELSQFSKEEWNSEIKEERIQALKRQL